MLETYTKPFKDKLVKFYSSGTRVETICKSYNVPRSTIYYWLKKYRVVKRTEREVLTANDIYLLNKTLQKVETENQILKECGCTSMSPRKERLEAIARLDGKYTIHALCRALNILRSTYYHYKLRRPKQTMIEKEDEMYKPIIKDIYDSTKGRIGAKKILAIMTNQGYRTT